MPAAAPVEIPLLLACSVAEQVAVLAVSVLVLVLVEDATEVVDVAPLSKRSVEMAAFITARYAPVEKFCLWQLFRLPQAKVLEAQAHTPQWALETVEDRKVSPHLPDACIAVVCQRLKYRPTSTYDVVVAEFWASALLKLAVRTSAAVPCSFCR